MDAGDAEGGSASALQTEKDDGGYRYRMRKWVWQIKQMCRLGPKGTCKTLMRWMRAGDVAAAVAADRGRLRTEIKGIAAAKGVAFKPENER